MLTIGIICPAVKQLLSIEHDFKCVLEEDGSEIPDDVLEAIINCDEKVGTIMILTAGQHWNRGKIMSYH